MKNLIAIIALFISLAAASQQKELDFKIEYFPKTNYTTQTTTTGTVTVTLEGEEAQAVAEAQGIENPMVEQTNTNSDMVMVTGTKKGNTIPFVLNISKSKETEKFMPHGASVYGTKATAQVPVFDSIVAKGASKMFKDALFETLKNTVTNAFLPPRKIKLGETFFHKVPLTIPMGGAKLEMVNNMEVTLNKIDGNLAYFTTKSNVTMATEIEGQNFTGSGTGNGSMVYDIAAQYMILQDDNAKLTMKMEMNGIVMSVATDTSVKIEATISKQ